MSAIFKFAKALRNVLITCGLSGGGKTIYWNFRLFPIRQAIYFPLFLGKDCDMVCCDKGSIIFDSAALRSGLLQIGIQNFNYPSKGKTIVNIIGKLIVKGNRKHQLGSNGHLTICKSGILEIGDYLGVGYGWHFMINAHSVIGDDCMFSLDYFDAAKWRNEEDHSIDAMTVFQSFAESSNKGPSFVNHRYITEDVPMGLGLFISIGRVVGVDTTIPESIMCLSSALLKQNLNAKARTIEYLLNIKNPTIEDIKRAII